ncbi:MAG: sporulation integral membrane protein YtvI [Eubacterium sp.]
MKNPKIKFLLTIILITIIVWLSIRFLLPMIIPFILAYIIAVILKPAISWLCDKANFHLIAATSIVLVAFTLLVILGGGFIITKLLMQIRTFISNWPDLEYGMNCLISDTCRQIESYTGINRVKIFEYISTNLWELAAAGKEKVISSIMENSVAIVTAVFEFIAAFIIMIIATFLYIKDEKTIKKWLGTFIFHKEYDMVAGKLSHVFRAYVRAQLIIMLAITAVCFIGLSIIKNPYSLLIGIIIGLLDALPMIGSGLILLPWAIVTIIGGNIKHGIVLMVIFGACYLIREVLEPKLIGKNAGISPLISLISIYVGYKAFGLFGVILGPIAFIIIAEVVSGLTKTQCENKIRMIYYAEDCIV